MSIKGTWRIYLLISFLILSSLGCEFTRQFTEWYRELDDSEEADEEHTLCKDNLIFGDYSFTCDESKNPKIISFSGKIFNNSDYYAHNVDIEVEFSGGYPIPSCTFNYGEIPPGGTAEALCQFKAQKCVSTITSVSTETCDMMSYPEHLDWLAEKDKKSSQDPDTDKNASFVLTQTHVDLLNETYKQSFEENPCEPEVAKQAFLTWLQGQANTWSDEAGKVIGEGKQFSDIETFMGWLTMFAKVGETSPTKSWHSDIELTISPLVSCFACTPPKLTGTLDLTVNLQTCQVTGKLSADGEGDVTINDCDENNKPIDETCTSHGTLNLTGDITGAVSKNGQLNLDNNKSKFVYSSQWVDGCEWDTQDVQKSNWEEPVTITGSLEWKGSATGKIEWKSSACQMTGDWTANQ
jgi:hypothetical protein